MAGTSERLRTAAQAYFDELRKVRASGGGTDELSYYPALRDLLCAVGSSLKPKVFPVSNLADQGAGHPDFGLYAAKQVKKGLPREGQPPERGVIEAKPTDYDAWLTADGAQVSRYWEQYRQVLVTNFRDFVLVGKDDAGRPKKLETLRLAENEDEFWRNVATPRAFASTAGAGLGEYLARAPSHPAALAEPKDLAWLLASYARDGPGAGRGGGRCAFAHGGALGVGGGAGRPLRGRQGRALLPFDSGADAVLRRLLRLGSVGTAGTAADRTLRLAHGGLASARAGAAGAVPATVRSRPPATARPRRGAGLDRRRTRPGGPARVLRALRRGRSGALLLRAVPGGLRSPAAQAARGLVHAAGSGVLHGRPRGPGAEG